jgi:hypothetical protein
MMRIFVKQHVVVAVAAVIGFVDDCEDSIGRGGVESGDAPPGPFGDPPDLRTASDEVDRKLVRGRRSVGRGQQPQQLIELFELGDLLAQPRLAAFTVDDEVGAFGPQPLGVRGGSGDRYDGQGAAIRASSVARLFMSLLADRRF